MLKFLNMSSKKQVKKVQVIIMAKGEILRLKLSEERGGFWQNITGHVDPGEDFVTAAKRELFEEVGFRAEVEELPFVYQFENRFGDEAFEKVFLCQLNQKTDPKLSDEHQSFEWKNIQEIAPEDFKYQSNFEPINWIKNR